MTEWISVKDRLPDEKTRYASKFGVSVLAFDRNEYKAEPFNCGFSFRDNCFKSLHYGSSGMTSLNVEVTDWAEMPDPPQQYKG